MSTATRFTMVTRAEAEELKPNDKPLSALTKTEASEWLRSLGEEPRVKWTSVDIKSRINEILDILVEEDSGQTKVYSGTEFVDQYECSILQLQGQGMLDRRYGEQD